MSRPNVIVEGQAPSGEYKPLKTNSSGELIVAGSVGGGSGAVQISDGSQTASITDVAGKKSLDVNVTDITLNHQNDSVTAYAKKYKKLIDEVDANTIYIGRAAPGASPSSAVWQITKIVFSGAFTDELLAGGSEAFNQIWNDRTSLSYS